MKMDRLRICKMYCTLYIMIDVVQIYIIRCPYHDILSSVELFSHAGRSTSFWIFWRHQKYMLLQISMPEVTFYGTGMNLVWKFVTTVIFWWQTEWGFKNVHWRFLNQALVFHVNCLCITNIAVSLQYRISLWFKNILQKTKGFWSGLNWNKSVNYEFLLMIVCRVVDVII
jgi:hypothetical protein